VTALPRWYTIRTAMHRKFLGI